MYPISNQFIADFQKNSADLKTLMVQISNQAKDQFYY